MKKCRFFSPKNNTSSNQRSDVEIKLDPALALPKDVIIEILKKLKFQDILNLNMVSSVWNRLSNNSNVLRTFSSGLGDVVDRDKQCVFEEDSKWIKKRLIIDLLETRKNKIESELAVLKNATTRPQQSPRRRNYYSGDPLTAYSEIVAESGIFSHFYWSFFENRSKNKLRKRKQKELTLVEDKIEWHKDY